MAQKSLSHIIYVSGNTLFLRLVLSLFIIFTVYSCGPEPAQTERDTVQGWTQNYIQDQVSLKLWTSKKELTIAEQLELMLETTTPENMEVKFPTYSASLGDFTLKDTRFLPARMTGTGDNIRVLHRITYILEPYLSGTYTIPAMTVTYSAKEIGAAAKELRTEKIDIKVKSLLAPDTGEIAVRDIKPPYSLPPDRVRQALLAGLVLLLFALGVYGFYFWEKRRTLRKNPVIEPGPDEAALQELDRLLADNLLATGKIKLFHLRISDILRHYIENRFGVRAQEQTTEEFLLELSRSGSSENSLLSNHKTLLADFLTQCDLVKFAKHEPSLMECEKTVLICREFIEKTTGKIEN